MKRNPTLPPNFMLGYAIAAPNLQNYGSQGRRCLSIQAHHSYEFSLCFYPHEGK
ncbi:hypothetical protein GNF10_05235 [Nostoc sp. UCD121]|uniref:hypothetical protein n=1 Tax=Nostoc sp. UCD121 TaxID=2681305 RepID=UPI00162566BE|nr:hypothetical protein [Nostoc sp. UCD121]MBC1221921.1 hypothetical protein [Nostoc sp. UCD120]MBC1275399.1 hypothetical protein [Nostoc sp. UCD121]